MNIILNNIFKPNSLNDFYSLMTSDKLTKKNEIFSATIIDFIKIEKSNYLNLCIRIGNESCNDFISLDVFANKLKIGDNITFNLNNIKVKLINDKNYIEIIDAKISEGKNEIKNDIKQPENIHFDFLKFVYSYNELWTLEKYTEKKGDYIYSIILKVNLIESSKNLGHQYEFYDIFGEKVPLDYSEIINFIEGQKIYIFSSLIVKKIEDSFQLAPLKYTSVTKVDENTIINKIMKIDGENIVSLKGKIEKFNLVEEEIEIIDEKDNHLKIKLNNRLLKKISLGCICDFKCFKQITNDVLRPTEFSEIIPNEKTSILFNCIY